MKKEDSIIVVRRNKQNIRKTITICLEEPFHRILDKWFEGFRNHGLINRASEIFAEIKVIRNHLVFEKRKSTAAVSGLQGGGTIFIVPDNVKDYLFR